MTKEQDSLLNLIPNPRIKVQKAVELARLELNIPFPNTEWMTNWDDWRALTFKYVETLSEKEIDLRLMREWAFFPRNELAIDEVREWEDTLAHEITRQVELSLMEEGLHPTEPSLISSALDKGLLNNNIRNSSSYDFELDKNKS